MGALLLLMLWAAARADAAAIEPLAGCRSETLVKQDDRPSLPFDLGFTMRLFGTTFDGGFINNNGNITAAALDDYTPEPIPGLGFLLIAPLWGDVDTTPSTSEAVTFGRVTFQGRTSFCVNWGGTTGVGYFRAHADKLDKFQLIIVNRADTGAGDVDLYFNYDQIQWDTWDPFAEGDAVNARWGFTNGDTADFEGPGSGVLGTLLDGGVGSLRARSTNSTVPGRHVFFVRNAAPDTSVVNPPGAPLADPQPSLAFSSNQPGVSFQCHLEGQSFAACTSPFRPSARLGDGAHTFTVRARNVVGVVDGTPATANFVVDTVAPDTQIGSGPSGDTPSPTSTFAFTSSEAGTFACDVDAAGFAPCGSPFTTAALGPGPHTFRVRAIDRAGNIDGSPATRAFRVLEPDGDADGVADRLDNCPDVSNAGQADKDGDRVGDSCELLPAGNKPPVAGKLAVLKAVSGEVFVKVPKGTKLPPLPPGESASGFLALDGLASIPVGSIVDARNGSIHLTTAAAYSTRGSSESEATVAAAMFKIKQARRTQANASGPVATDLIIQTPPGKARACASKPRSSHTVIRRLRASVNGIFRTRASALTVIARRASFVTHDRCDGTLARVVRGRAAVLDKNGRRRARLSTDRSYLIRARLFAARRGRG